MMPMQELVALAAAPGMQDMHTLAPKHEAVLLHAYQRKCLFEVCVNSATPMLALIIHLWLNLAVDHRCAHGLQQGVGQQEW